MEAQKVLLELYSSGNITNGKQLLTKNSSNKDMPFEWINKMPHKKLRSHPNRCNRDKPSQTSFFVKQTMNKNLYNMFFSKEETRATRPK